MSDLRLKGGHPFEPELAIEARALEGVWRFLDDDPTAPAAATGRGRTSSPRANRAVG